MIIPRAELARPRSALVSGGLLLGLVVSACGGTAEPGTMTAAQYRSLASQESTLTLEEARDRGADQSAALEQRWLSEGGAAAEAGADCWYAETTNKTRYRGTARFCFDEQGKAVSVERNRADLEESPYP